MGYSTNVEKDIFGLTVRKKEIEYEENIIYFKLNTFEEDEIFNKYLYKYKKKRSKETLLIHLPIHKS
jgi:hypothetical protein